MESMTGYGYATCTLKTGNLELILKSFNGKHLDIFLQIPQFYGSLESEISKILKSQFRRGRVELILIRTPEKPSLGIAGLTVNQRVLLKWQNTYKKLARHFKTNMKNQDTLHFLNMPGVIEKRWKAPKLSEQEKNRIKALVKKAALLCKKERLREGRVLRQFFEKALKEINQCLMKIKHQVPLQDKRAKLMLKKKWKKAGLSLKNHEKEPKNAFFNEYFVSLIRHDISEEINRLEQHIKTVKMSLSKNQTTGKWMGFYLQEMLREFNTINSKTQDLKTQKHVITAKHLIETMREQSQNIQ